MTLLFSGFLLALFGLSLILITLSLYLLRRTGPAGETYPFAARYFLIALRLAIGWHCFIEGMEKVNTPAWSSEVYLRESVGPLSGPFRWLAGDPLIAKATVGPDDAFPAELEREWRNYFDAFAAYHNLTKEQLDRAQGILDQRKKDALTYLLSKSELVTKISALPPELKVEMTMKQRLDEHERLLNKFRDAEAKLPSIDKDVHAEWKSAKSDLAKWRSDLKRSIDAETAKLKRIDRAEATKLKKNIDALTAKWKKAEGKKAAADKLKKELDEETAKLREPLADVLTSEQKMTGPMPDLVGKPVSMWGVLDFADFLVKWGLVVLGGCLMLGLFSRLSSLATAFLLFSFYAAMPPLPGWPESPRLEGHYLLINKTLIEVIALLALTFIPTGRWAGIDGLIYGVSFLCCGGPRNHQESNTTPDS